MSFARLISPFVLAPVAVAKAAFAFARPSAEWHFYYTKRPRVLIDGTSDSGPLMRRWTGTEWVYRAATDDEHFDDIDRHAW